MSNVKKYSNNLKLLFYLKFREYGVGLTFVTIVCPIVL